MVSFDRQRQPSRTKLLHAAASISPFLPSSEHNATLPPEVALQAAAAARVMSARGGDERCETQWKSVTKSGGRKQKNARCHTLAACLRARCNATTRGWGGVFGAVKHNRIQYHIRDVVKGPRVRRSLRLWDMAHRLVTEHIETQTWYILESSLIGHRAFQIYGSGKELQGLNPFAVL